MTVRGRIPSRAIEGTFHALGRIGRDEGRLAPDVATRIACEAARIAATDSGEEGRGDEPRGGGVASSPPPTVTVLPSAPPARPRRWYPAVAAAAVLMAAAGYALLARPGQPISTDGAVLSSEPTTTTESGPTASTTNTREGDPDSSNTGSSITESSITESSVTGNDVEPSPTANGVPSSTIDESTTGTIATTEASTNSTGGQSPMPNSPTMPALLGDGLPIIVGDAGAVALRIDGWTASVVDVATNPGWTYRVTLDAGGGLAVTFTGNGDTATLRAEFVEIPTVDGDDEEGDEGDKDKHKGKNGDKDKDDDDDDEEDREVSEVFQLVVEPNSAYQGFSTTSRQFDLGLAGLVEIRYDAAGVTDLTVVAESGWSPSVNTPGPEQLDIRLVGSDDDATARHRLEIGPLVVTINAGN